MIYIVTVEILSIRQITLYIVTNGFSSSVTKETRSNITDTPGSIGIPQYIPENESVENSIEREVRLTD